MKLHTPLILIAALTASGVALADGPIDGKVYGLINLSLDNVDRDDNVGTPTQIDEWQLNSNASRFGYKGETALDESLSVIYQVEWEVSVDGSSTDLTARNRFLGLKGGWGTIIAGRHDTPTKDIGKKVDLFNDLFGDIKNTFEGENRAPNIAIYSSPMFGNFTTHVAFMPGEDTAAGNDSINDGMSAVIEGNVIDNLYLALAIDRDVDGQDLERFVAQYTMGDFVFAAMLQQNEDDLAVSQQDESGMAASVAYKVGANTFKFQYGKIDNDATAGTFEDEDTLSIGYDRKLGTNTKFFSYITMDQDTNGNAEDELTVIGAGFEHKF